MRTSTVVKALLAATAVTPLLCHAESTFTTGAGSPLTATARVDFQITIPKFIFLRVGTGTGAINAAGAFTTAPATGGGVDPITWAPTAAQVGTGALAGTGGDLTGGVETAVLVANNGTVTLTVATGGPLMDPAGDTINYTQITTTASINHTAAVLQAPVLANGGGSTVTLVPGASRVISQDAQWAYSYANATIPAAGTYGGVNTNNSRATYTASVP